MHHKAKEHPETVELARQLHDEGLGYKLIAKKLEISVWTIRDWLTYRTRING